MNFQDPGIITAALTSSGALLWAYAIQFILQVIKGVPQFGSLLNGREKLFCFVASFVVVILAFVASLQAVPPAATFGILGIIGMVLAGFNIARLSMAAYDDFVAKEASGKRPSESVLSAKGWNGK